MCRSHLLTTRNERKSHVLGLEEAYVAEVRVGRNQVPGILRDVEIPGQEPPPGAGRPGSTGTRDSSKDRTVGLIHKAGMLLEEVIRAGRRGEDTSTIVLCREIGSMHFWHAMITEKIKPSLSPLGHPYVCQIAPRCSLDSRT